MGGGSGLGRFPLVSNFITRFLMWAVVWFHEPPIPLARSPQSPAAPATSAGLPAGRDPPVGVPFPRCMADGRPRPGGFRSPNMLENGSNKREPIQRADTDPISEVSNGGSIQNANPHKEGRSVGPTSSRGFHPSPTEGTTRRRVENSANFKQGKSS